MEQPFYAIYMITYKLYHRLRKFARGNIDFIEDFSLGHAEYPPPKWQSRVVSNIGRMSKGLMVKKDTLFVLK